MTLTPSQSTYLNLLSIWGVTLPELPNIYYKIEQGVLYVKKDFNMLEAIRNAHAKNCVNFDNGSANPTEETFTINAVHTPILAYLAYSGVKALPFGGNDNNKSIFVNVSDAVDLAYTFDRLGIGHKWTQHTKILERFEFPEYEEKGNLYLPTTVVEREGAIPMTEAEIEEALRLANNNIHNKDVLAIIHKAIIEGKVLIQLDRDRERAFDINREVTDKLSKAISDTQSKVTKILKPTAYLSGKITGLSVEEYTAKFNAVDELLNNAYVVINPVTLCASLDNTGATWADYMGLCCKELFKFKDTPKHLTIFMLAGWEDSTGARVEHAIATELGFRIVYLK